MDNKLTYRIRNWAEYNRALIQRGSLTIWFEEAAAKWCEKKPSKRGRPRTYSDDAILCALVLRAVYHLPLRQLRGFLLWIFTVMCLKLPVPCYTRICRRASSIGQELKKLTSKRPKDIVFDSTGVKVYGEGEWKVRQHGKGKRRVWRKIHLAVCPNSHEIVLSHRSRHRCMTSTNGEIKLITGVERRRRWSIQEKQAIVNQTYQLGASVSLVARQHGINPCQLFTWRRLMEEGALQGISSDGELVPKSVVKELQKRVAELERLVGKKTLEIEILQEAVRVIQEKKHMLLQSWPKAGGSP